MPFDLVPSGPRVARIAARFADPEWVAGFVVDARRHAAAGRDSAAIQFGAWVNAVLHDEEAVARDAVRGTAALWARFSAFQGRDLRGLPGPLARAAAHLRAHYDMQAHGEGVADHARDLPDDFLDWFIVTGPVAGRRRAGRCRGLAIGERVSACEPYEYPRDAKPVTVAANGSAHVDCPPTRSTASDAADATRDVQTRSTGIESHSATRTPDATRGSTRAGDRGRTGDVQLGKVIENENEGPDFSGESE